MRSDAKAATAGSNRRRAIKRKPGLLLLCLAACVAALAVVVGSASAAKTHIFKEVFGASAQPTFTTPRGMAIDQGTGEVYVIDAGSPPSLKRYNANGTASDFSALASNTIDGAGGADTTPQGSLAFGFATRVQIAIDESGSATDGDIYVAQAAAKLVDVFDSTGTYKGQLTESSEGLLGEICGVAVDSAGKIYLGDIAGKIHVYEPAANPPVNGDSSANFATVASPCQIAAGTGATAGFIFVNRSNGELLKVDSATGEVKYQLGSVTHRTVYVNPASGHVYAPRQTGGSSEVVEYDASGAGSATTVSSVKPGSTIEGIAVRESTGDLYLTRSGQSMVQVYGPTVTQPDVTSTAPSSNTGVRATLAGTVNPDGVELSECKFEWSLDSGEFGNTVPCAESNATIGSGTSPVAVHADISGLTPQGTFYKYRLVAKNAESPAVTTFTQSFQTPKTVITTAASGATETAITLNGTVNPDTATISGCVFEWGPQKGELELVQQYPNTSPCVPGPGSITGTSPVAVHADISGLHTGSQYVYRLKATYPTGPATGATLIAQTTGPRIAATWAESVVRTEATLKAEIDPEGQATTYHFDYGTSEAYGAQTPEIVVGSDSSAHAVTRFLEGLTPGTTYHYRTVATSAGGENAGPDRSFTTYANLTPDTSCPNQVFRGGPAANLPDCRAYEMVSPVDKNNGDIAAYESLIVAAALNQAALDGGKISYSTYKSFADSDSAPYTSQYLATRGAGGWSTHAISPPSRGGKVTGLGFIDQEYQAFSPDLSFGWVIPESGLALAPGGAPEHENLYRYDIAADVFDTLSLGGSVRPVTTFRRFDFAGASQDNRHAIFSIADSLNAEATGAEQKLYEWFDGQVKLVSRLPDGSAVGGVKAYAGAGRGVFTRGRLGWLDHAISNDGSRIFWTAATGSFDTGQIYVRIDGSETVPVSESVSTLPARFRGASADGSTVFFTIAHAGGPDDDELYEFDVDTETPTPIATEVTGVAGTSDDGSYVYFVSTADLDAGATSGGRNLYVRHNGVTRFIATLSPGDFAGTSGNLVSIEAQYHLSRVSDDGRHLAFMSSASLTGYDNSVPGVGPVAEVYRYDADSEQLSCASCNPSGARPDASNGFPKGPFIKDNDKPVAAWISGWVKDLHAPRNLSQDGDRVFFNSFAALVPHDTNGVQDVYQWEAPGSGSCSEAAADFSSVTDGCTSLISSGESPVESEFVDADSSGGEAFIRTKSGLVPQDPGLFDIYVAKAGGGFPAPAQAASCSGDSCQNPSIAPRGLTPSSATFRGAGNPTPARAARSCGAQARRAARLSRRARGIRRRAGRLHSAPGRARALRRAARLAGKAKKLSRRAQRCRRANRRAKR